MATADVRHLPVTRDAELVDLSWELQGYRFELPVLAAALAGLAIIDVLAGVRRRRTVMA